MALSEILTVIGLFLAYAGALIGVYVNIRVKIKALEIQILNLQNNMEEHKERINEDVRRLEEKNTHEHEAILFRIDALLEKISDMYTTLFNGIKPPTPRKPNFRKG